MKNIKSFIAVLATAALMVATSFAADNYSPASIGSHSSVAVDPSTGLQINPPALTVLQGFNGSITNGFSATGSNFVIAPTSPFQLINAGTNVNFVHATNTASGFSVKVLINPGVANRTITWPSTWNWRTNSLDTNQVIGKVTSVPTNTYGFYSIEAISNIVLMSGTLYRP